MATRQTAGTRAKDDDRTRTCQILDGALGDGQLSMEEHRQRVAAATTAATLGDLQSLVGDLQTEQALPELKKESRLRADGTKRAWGIPLAVTAVLVVLGIAIGWGLYGNSTSPLDFTTDPGAKPDGVVPVVVTPPKELQSLGGLSGLFAQMRTKFGDTTGYSLSINPDDAYLQRTDPRDDRRVLNYRYQGGWGDPSEGTKSDGQRVVDLSNFEWPKVMGLVKGAPQTLEMGSQRIDDVTINIDPSRDPLTPDAVNIRIAVDGEFGNGTLELAPDGAIKSITPVKTS
ncbi:MULTISPECIES: DUF1707 domain-containing protein [unclassified Mycobacterium]|uniref:DUF1707 SHOCT-like domain-containing protein n=1 Tax=unclassified Mycobacterium TaxID=2642494 RepID=UPI0029C7CC57|nr:MULTISPECIES: DUF1707 domain-containing protein [unclassified Mycobacterium]